MIFLGFLTLAPEFPPQVARSPSVRGVRRLGGVTKMISLKKFQRKIEDFICANCGAKVKGAGYTNHCPKCLWSRHVDVNPGDRAAKCGGTLSVPKPALSAGGMMEPIGIEIKAGEYIITHRCVKCGHEKKNKTVAADEMEKIIEISKRSD